MLAFANFSHAIWPDRAGGLLRRTLDYSKVGLSLEAGMRHRLGGQLAAIALLVEDAFGQPQDIEGLVVGDHIYLVQSRPQQGA